jgi:carboxymethylenebutenolidase
LFDSGAAYDPELWKQITSSLPSHPEIVGAVVYGDAATSSSLAQASIPTLQHLAGAANENPKRQEDFTVYHYPEAESFLFATPFQKTFNYSSEGVSHTRNLTFLKRRMNGPYFDLEAIWEEHTYYEFEARSVPHTMATMVQEPYVNHIPTVGLYKFPATDLCGRGFCLSWLTCNLFS